MRKSTALLGVGVVALAVSGGVHAQTNPTVTGAATLGYGTASADGATVDLWSLDVESDIIVTRAFGVGLDFGLASGSLSIDGIPGDTEVDATYLSVEPAYSFGGGGFAGAYYSASSYDATISPLLAGAFDLASYGVFGGYRMGDARYEAWAGLSDLEVAIPFDADIMDYGLSASFGLGAEFEVFASAIWTSVDLVGLGFDLTTYALGGEYDLQNGITTYGSIELSEADLGIGGVLDATEFTIGGSYLLDTFATPIALGAEYTRSTGDAEGNRFAIGLTIPFGSGSSEPRNSSTRAARGAYRSSFQALAQ